VTPRENKLLHHNYQLVVEIEKLVAENKRLRGVISHCYEWGGDEAILKDEMDTWEAA
jgi:hypothetical protein